MSAFVLQHGAWHGRWCWSCVAERLRSAGHRVFTPTSTGVGERAHLVSSDVTLQVWVTDLVCCARRNSTTWYSSATVSPGSP